MNSENDFAPGQAPPEL